MLDDDFKEIEDFLKSGGNVELQTFQKFEKIIDDYMINKFKDDIKEGFITFNVLIYQSYSEFEKNNSSVVRDFAITAIVIKKLLSILKDTPVGIILSEEDKKAYRTLMKMVIDAMKKESDSHINFFKAFTEYISDISNLLSVND